MAKAKVKKISPDNEFGPTPERLSKSDGLYSVMIDLSGSRRMHMRDDPLSRMYANFRTDDEPGEYAALLKFRKHHDGARMAGNLRSIDLDRVGVTDGADTPRTESETNHLVEYRRAVDLIGPVAARFVEAVVCFDKPLHEVGTIFYATRAQAAAAASGIIRAAASSLARLWKT